MQYLKIFILVLFTFVLSSPSYSLEKNLSLVFWFDHNPPTKNDTDFFKGSANSIEVLNSNNVELETSARNKGIKTYSNQYAQSILNTIIQKNGIKEDFFYDLEKAQLILVTRMFLNNCKVNQKCSEAVAKQYSEKFIQYAKNQTSENRNISQNRAADALNDAMLKSMVRWYVVKIVKGVINC